LCNIGTGSLTTWDESNHAIIAKEILQRGDWSSLYLAGKPFFDKPPLYMWLTASFYRIFGISEFSARLTSSLFGILTIALVYLFGSSIADKKVGIFSALMLLGMPHYLHFSKMAMLDVALTFFITLMIFLFLKGADNAKLLFFSGLMLGFAYLIKGFAGFLGIFIIFWFALFSGRIKDIFNPNFILGIMCSIGIIFLWHYSQYMIFGKESASDYFGLHILSRATKGIDAHTGGINFYQKAIFNKNKPWSVLIYLSLPFIIWRAFKYREKCSILLCCWIAIAYMLYTFVKTKLHWYIIPAYPALAISSALLLGKNLKGKTFNAAVAIICVVLFLQVPFSWAFKLDFSPDVKDASGYVSKMHDNDSTIYFYGGYDNKDVFYFDDYVTFISKVDNRLLDMASKKDVYLIVRSSEAQEISNEYNLLLKPVKQYSDIVIYQLKFKGNKI